MRRSGSEKPGWVVDDNGVLIGIQLGADYCAEHECGIKGIKRELGILSKDECDEQQIFGADRYTVLAVNTDQFHFRETKTTHEAVFIFNPRVFGRSWMSSQQLSLEQMTISKLANHYDIHLLGPWKDHEAQTLATAWDEASFGIHVKGKQDHEYLRELQQAFIDQDVVVYLGAPPIPVFSNSSLNLMIKSRIPQEGLDLMEKTDRELWELNRDAKATGIYDKLEEAGMKYHALKPRRGLLKDRVTRGRFSEKIPPTSHDIMFFLNPTNQDNNNSGWFTVEELEAWAEGKGPIPKKEKV